VYKRSLIAVVACWGMIAVAMLPCMAKANDSAWIVGEMTNLPLEEFVDESYQLLVGNDPDTLWGWGTAEEYGLEDLSEWTEISDDVLGIRAALASEILHRLRDGYPRNELSLDKRINYDAYEWLLEDVVRQSAYPYWGYVIGMSSYGAHNLALDLLDGLPIGDAEDAWAYITRIEAIDEWMDQLLAAYRERETAGVIPPGYGLEMTVMELDMTVPPEDAGGCDPESLSAYTTLEERLEELPGITGIQRSGILSAARDAIEANLIPAFRTYRAYVSSLLDIDGDVGVAGYQGGAAYYEWLLEHHVSKPISAEEIRNAGEAAVRGLQDQMRVFAAEVLGWPESLTMAELEDRIVAANVPILQGNELLREYEQHIAKVDGRLREFFNVLPESDLVITVDLDGPPAYYIEPPIDRSGPGQIVTSLVNVVPFLAYDEPVLMHHEGIPGHHMQLALARDLDLPDFRRDLMSNVYTRHPLFQAYTEGWALYAEHLAAEMGVYQDDPIGHLCQLRLMLARLVRLVADTGINAFGWSWEQAAAYLQQQTGRASRMSEMIRYDSYPGQACAYGMGYLTILELRQRAMDALGDAFDIKAFHDTILLHGPMPLSTLEWVANEWISEAFGQAAL